jgi:hypothetical protein
LYGLSEEEIRVVEQQGEGGTMKDKRAGIYFIEI